MSKNYDLYPKFERKIDNWRRRILGYEKMKRDLQRQIQLLKNKNKKQKGVIDRVNKYLHTRGIQQCYNGRHYRGLDGLQVQVLEDILNEVSK